MKLLIIRILLFLLPFNVCAELTPGPKARSAGDLALLVIASDSLKYIEDWVSTSSGVSISVASTLSIFCKMLTWHLCSEEKKGTGYFLIDMSGEFYL